MSTAVLTGDCAVRHTENGKVGVTVANSLGGPVRMEFVMVAKGDHVLPRWEGARADVWVPSAKLEVL